MGRLEGLAGEKAFIRKWLFCFAVTGLGTLSEVMVYIKLAEMLLT